MSDITIDKLVKVYVRIRDERARIKAEFDRKYADLGEQMEKVEHAMLKLFHELGDIKNIRTEYGTAYRDEELFAKVEDWDLYWQWVKENDVPEALERRVKRAFIKEYMEANEGRLPPAVSVHREDRIRVRVA